MSPESTIWRRRVILMLAVGLIVGAAFVVLSDEPEPEVNGSGEDRALPELGEEVRLAAGAVRLPAPEGWRAEGADGVAQATSPDGSVRIAVATAGERGQARQAFNTTVRALRRNYDGLRIEGAQRARVAELPARSVLALARTPEGTAVRILSSAVAGELATYLVQVFAAEGAPAERLLEAQVALDALRLDRGEPRR